MLDILYKTIYLFVDIVNHRYSLVGYKSYYSLIPNYK